VLHFYLDLMPLDELELNHFLGYRISKCCFDYIIFDNKFTFCLECRRKIDLEGLLDPYSYIVS